MEDNQASNAQDDLLREFADDQPTQEELYAEYQRMTENENSSRGE